MRSYLAKLTADLVQFRSIDDDPKYRSELFRIVAFVEKRLKKLRGVFVQRLSFSGKPFLVVTFRKNHKKPKVFFNGHLDVVPAQDNQFQPKLQGRKLYGRGTNDMKGGCAVMIALIEYFAKQEIRPDIGFMFVTDEEVYGRESRMLFQKRYRPQFLITVESTELDIILETKGILWMEGIIRGKPAHGSMPWLGESAVEKFYLGLKKFYKKFPSLKRPRWKTTVNIGKVNGGEAFNTVPPSLHFTLDVRYISQDDPQKLELRIRRCFPKNTVWRIQKCEPSHKKTDDMRLARQLKKAAGFLRLPTRYARATYATDARFFSAGGVPCVVFGSKGGDMHGKKEWVDVRSLEKVYETLKLFCERFGGF